MTRTEWETATDPEPLWDALPAQLPESAYFHYTYTVLKQFPDLLNEDQARVFQALEWFARRQTTRPVRRGVFDALQSASRGDIGGTFGAMLGILPLGSRFLARHTTQWLNATHIPEHDTRSKLICDFHREILGPASDLTQWDDAWATEDVRALAWAMEQEKDFTRMPILADMLEEAGCHCELTLHHARAAVEIHLPGCWLLSRITANTNAGVPWPPAWQDLVNQIRKPNS